MSVRCARFLFLQGADAHLSRREVHPGRLTTQEQLRNKQDKEPCMQTREQLTMISFKCTLFLFVFVLCTIKCNCTSGRRWLLTEKQQLILLPRTFLLWDISADHHTTVQLPVGAQDLQKHQNGRNEVKSFNVALH